jgi:hypothetical protein
MTEGLFEETSAPDEQTSAKRPIPNHGEICLLAEQASVLARRDEYGNLLLIQREWPDDEVTILVHRDYEMQFLDSLCDLVGIASVGRRGSE